MTKYKIFLALYTRRMSCLGPIVLLGTGPPWKEELACQVGGRKKKEACSPPKEHQESGVRECSYLQSGIHPLVGGLSAPCKIFPLKKKKRFQRLPKIPETYSSI